MPLPRNMPVRVVRRGPVWAGPSGEGPNGGVTFSLLSRFLTCRERFRVRVVEGLKPQEDFNHRIKYGNMWHVCEEALAKGNDPTRGGRSDRKAGIWEEELLIYAQKLARYYPLRQEQVDHWYRVCRVQFPAYVDHWKAHPDVVNRTPLLAEQVFDVLYTLPSRRVVRLRGKWDSVDLVNGGIWLQENKTKGDIDEAALTRQMRMDLQTMLYLVALQFDRDAWEGTAGKGPPVGVRYNVVRRPLSGGKHTIVRHKPTGKNPAGEGRDEYYERLGGLIRNDPGYYFLRLNVTLSPGDITAFRKRCLDPILEQLCDWWECMEGCGGDPWKQLDAKDVVGTRRTLLARYHHWQHPFGVANTIDEYGHGDLDEYLASGNEAGLRRTDDLFPELKEG